MKLFIAADIFRRDKVQHNTLFGMKKITVD